MNGVMSKIPPDEQVSDGVRMLRWRGTPFPGRVFVFLHGLGDGADVWRPVINAWAEGPITAVAIDFPGHGGSDFHDPNAYSVPKFASWLADALAREGIRDPILIGHSMGARVLLEAAHSGVVRPSHAVIVDVSPDVVADKDIDSVIEDHLEMLAAGATNLTSFRQKIGMRLPLADKDVLAEIIPALVAAGGDSDGPGVRMRLDPEIRRLLGAPTQVDGWNALAALGCPTTIIRGAFSSALDTETAQKMTRTLRQPSGCLTVPKAGHAIAFEQPAALAKAIAQGIRGAT